MEPQPGQIRKRNVERHCAASLRALSGVRDAEFRSSLLFRAEIGVPLLTPHLSLDVTQDSYVRCRGVTDAMALRLLHSDLEMHTSLMPENEFAAMVFDLLEQLRVERLSPPGLSGMRMNLQQAFEEWCRLIRGAGVAENEIDLLLYSVTQVARTHVLGARLDEEVEGLIESTRFHLGPLIGHVLKALPCLCHDQFSYAQQALDIARVVQEFIGESGEVRTDARRTATVRRLMIPPRHENTHDNGVLSSGGTERTESERRSQEYHVFCRDHDRELSGFEVVPLASRRRSLRLELDRMVQAQAVSIPRLAQRLKNLFSAPVQAGWNFGEEDGYLDGRRLSQIVVNPAYRRIFRQRQSIPQSETVVSFLIDNSGSMKRQRHEAVAVLVDIYSRALDLAGIDNEILGFTTAGWNGGKSIQRWRRMGSPENPGRLNDRLHVVYKDAGTPWRRARESISSLCSTHHFREGLDGEALEWAAGRLRAVSANRRCLVMISDGSPMDTATSHHNPIGYLDNHLRSVVSQLEAGGEIELCAIGNHLELDEFFSRSIVLDLNGTLGTTEFRALEQLYGHRRI